MPITISDNLRLWLETKNLQGYIRIAEASPHPNAAKIAQQIDIAKITNKQVRRILNLKREGFDAVQKMDKETLRSYFGEYSPSAKAFQTMGGQDEFFHEVAKFMLEVAFVTPRFYGMPKKRAGFIIATYEGEKFDWGLLSAEALREQLSGIQQKGKMMKTIIARWLSVLFPPQSSENRREERRQARARRPVPREEWQEEESAQAETIQPEPEQQQPVQPPVPEATPVPSIHFCPRLATYWTNTGMHACRANRAITAPAKKKAEGRKVSAEVTERTSLKKKENGAHTAVNTTFSDSGISPPYLNWIGPCYSHNGASCQS